MLLNMPLVPSEPDQVTFQVIVYVAVTWSSPPTPRLELGYRYEQPCALTGASQVCSLAFHDRPGPGHETVRDPSPGVKFRRTGVAVAAPHTAPAVTVLLTGCQVAGSVQNQVLALTMV